MPTDLRDQLQSTLGAAYTVERELGGGGMSRVFVATDTALGRHVVVKVLPAELAASVNVERFRREIAVAAQLQHPHIVPVLSAGASESLPYFIMPFVEGESLRARLEREVELPIPEVVRLLIDVAKALAYAHRHGVVHRDIKPENILCSDEAVLVTDFGVAKALSVAGSDALTSTGITLGTPRYMAPEQAAADPHIDHRADFYSFGTLAYELLAGQTPFGARSAQQLMAAHMTLAPEPVERLRPAVPPVLAALVMRCLEKHPADRPQSAEEIIRELGTAMTPSNTGAPSGARVAAVAVHAPRRRAIIGGITAAVLLVAAVSAAILRNRGAGSKDGAPTSSSSAGALASLVVLPFVNVGGSVDNEYFADGMTDELTSALAKVPGLRVVSRTSAFSYKGKTIDVREVARSLGVTSVIEGTVRRVGDQLRLTAQLTSARDGFVLWTESYDRELRDVFDVQDAVAREIVTALRPTLGGDSVARVASAPRGTEDLEAYDLYLRGRYWWSRRGESQLRRAIRLFEQAIARDQRFARAWAGLALANAILPPYSTVTRPDSVLPLAIRAAERALSLDSTEADAHIALGYAYLGRFQWAESEQHFRKAIAIDPSNAAAHHWYADLLYAVGRAGDALPEMRRAFELDPLSAIIANDLAYTLGFVRRFDESMVTAHRSIELDSTLRFPRLVLGGVLIQTGQRDSAVRVIESAVRSDGDDFARSVLAFAYGMAGRRAEAEVLLAGLRRDFAAGRASAYAMATAHSGLGASDSAVAWLERSLEARDGILAGAGLPCDPTFERLRSDARFLALLKRAEMGPCMTEPTVQAP